MKRAKPKRPRLKLAAAAPNDDDPNAPLVPPPTLKERQKFAMADSLMAVGITLLQTNADPGVPAMAAEIEAIIGENKNRIFRSYRAAKA